MSVCGGMLDPAIDEPGKPFSYFWHPTDVVGALFAPVASEVTPEGYVYNGFGELMFFIGNPPVPVNQRLKQLHEGYLPLVQFDLVHHEVRYCFEIFAADMGGPLAGLPVNLVRVELRNECNEERAAFLSSAFRTMPPVDHAKGPVADYRFGQRFDLIPPEYSEGQTGFRPDWEYAFAGHALARDGRLLYAFPADPAPQQLSLSLTDPAIRAIRFFTGEVQANPKARPVFDRHAPMGVVTYCVRLNPGATRSLVFRMPVAPVPLETPAARLLLELEPEQVRRDTIRSWQDLLHPAPMSFPEEKVQQYLLANTIFDLLAIDRVGPDTVINVNKFQYHRLYPGNGSNMCVALDYMGLHDIARDCLLQFRKVQFPDGSIRNPHHPEGQSFEITGYALWAWDRHTQLTRDRAFLEAVYPGVQAAVAWLKKMAADDPCGLLPPATVADDAMLANVRQTGMSLWALIALRSAGRMAGAIGNRQDREEFEDEYARYRQAFERHLATQLRESDGVIPPALERSLAGNRWDDLLLLYPEPLFDPFDPRVTATIHEARQRYAEGILEFGWQRAVARTADAGWPTVTHAGIDTVKADGFIFDDRPLLHYWQTPNNAQNALVRGTPEDQEEAVRDLYALLLHTSSTHAPQEFGTAPWSTRDYMNRHNILPDGAASAKTIELLRNMLVREYQDDLVLFSALSPEWVRAGKVIELRRAPTAFGPISVRCRTGGRDNSLVLDIAVTTEFVRPPRRLLLRAPWFLELESVECDGSGMATRGNVVSLPFGVSHVSIRGSLTHNTPRLSYEETVAAYREEYRRRYEEFLRTGTTNGRG